MDVANVFHYAIFATIVTILNALIFDLIFCHSVNCADHQVNAHCNNFIFDHSVHHYCAVYIIVLYVVVDHVMSLVIVTFKLVEVR